MASAASAQLKPAVAAVEVVRNGDPCEEAWVQALALSCALTVDLALPGFTVRDWLQLNRESVIDSRWQVTGDVPLRVNGVLIAWVEFEVVNDHRAVRVTQLD
jgi:flagellar motor switch/type III secretory pathway protein FliN